MKTFKHEGAPQKLSKMILDKYPEIGYFSLQKLFRKSDIKVNGKRISTDQTIFVGKKPSPFSRFYMKTKIFSQFINRKKSQAKGKNRLKKK